jgi:hypothetical protein
MYYFVPRLPTSVAAAAAAAGPFQPVPTLKGLVEQLKQAPPPLQYGLRGQLILSDPDQPVQNLVTYQFSGVRDLELHLERLRWDPTRISTIYLYEHGSFKVCGAAPKPLTLRAS